MLDAVIGYALINIIFELTCLAITPPWTRLRVLGNRGLSMTIHVVMFVFTLWVHWGTLVGTTGAFAAFPTSMFAVMVAKQFWGYVTYEPTNVDTTNWASHTKYLNAEQITRYEQGEHLKCVVSAPVFHRRAIGYTKAELI